MFAKSFLAVVFATTAALAQLEVVTTGLQAPQKMIVTPSGSLLVSETSLQPNSGRVSRVTQAGVRQTLLEGLPSGTDSQGGSSGPTGLALRERTLYIAIGGGDAERMSPTPGRPMHNPQGASSPLFASILAVRLSEDVGTLTAPFTMTPAHQQVLNDGGEVRIDNGSGATATVTAFVRFPISEPDPNTVYRFSNPWGLALSEDGATLMAVDASMNALVRIDTATGRWQRILRFPPQPNSTPVGPPVVDAVPTSVRYYGNEVLVSFLTGFPFTPGAARVLSVNPAERTSQPFILGLTSVVDIVWRPTSGDRPQFFALEFSQNQGAQPAAPGRLLRFDTPAPQVVSSELTAPVSLAFDASSNSLYVLELTGRLLRMSVN